MLSDEDWAVIRRHPQDGATLVGALDGYGPVADAILYHHEHIDGSGYPAGLIGNEIPLASRILAICSIYDTMTARDDLPLADDAPGSHDRAAAGSPGASSTPSSSRPSSRCCCARTPPSWRAREDADFETELAFESRVRQMAQPKLRI